MIFHRSPGIKDYILCRVNGEKVSLQKRYVLTSTVEPLLRGHPDERPPPLERPLDDVNLNINVLISTPDERPPLLKGHFSGAKGVASQKGFHCSLPPSLAFGIFFINHPVISHHISFSKFAELFMFCYIEISPTMCV